uniref:Cilia- and flagella-associated protein 126 n=1 Tax=Cacopsylla melanoneura TaxID=428564 RepID=A0A8D8ZAA8_9HEMI
MSFNYSAQQYDSSFKPTRLGNWEVPKIHHKPQRLRGCVSEYIANERGHLYPEHKCGNKHPFCTYIGTYGMPRRITRELATKLGQFPQHYDVVNKTLFTPCHRENKCKQITSERDRSAYRKMVRKCIEDNVDENIEDLSELRGQAFVRKVKNCVDVEKQFAKIVKDCVLETIHNGNAINEDVMVSTVKKCVREKLGLDVKDDDEATGRIQKIVQDCMDKELKGKDILKTNMLDLKRNIKGCVDERLGRKSPSDKDVAGTMSDKNDALRKRVKECIHELDPSEFDSSVKDKIKECVKDKKQNEQKAMDKFEGDEELRSVVRKCIKENENDEMDPAQVKERVKDCVKNNMEAKDKPEGDEELRQKVKQCIKEHEHEKLDSKQMRQRIKDCVKNLKPKDSKESNKEKEPEDKGDNKQAMMRKAVQDCIKKHKPSDKMNEAEYKDKIKKCADENLNFRQAVRECIPKHFGKDDLEKKVKECAKEMIREKKNRTDDKAGKEREFRAAVQECMKEKQTNKNTSESEFKKIVKDCALRKLKGK